MLQLKKKLLIFFLFSAILLVIFVFLFFNFQNNEETKEADSFFKTFKTGIVKNINQNSIIISVSNPDLNSEKHYLDLIFKLEDGVELLKETSIVKSEEEFLREQVEKNKGDVDNFKPGATNWFKVKNITLLEIKIGDLVDVYYEEGMDNIAKRILVAGDLEPSEHYNSLESNRMLGVSGKIFKIERDKNIIGILIDDFGFSKENNKQEFIFSDKTIIYKKEKKEEAVFKKEYDDFLVNFKNAKNVDNLEAPKWFEYTKYNIDNLRQNDSILIKYKEEANNSVINIEEIILIK